MMPPSYVNIGAFVDEGTMIDSNVLVGSCAQIGKEESPRRLPQGQRITKLHP